MALGGVFQAPRPRHPGFTQRSGSLWVSHAPWFPCLPSDLNATLRDPGLGARAGQSAQPLGVTASPEGGTGGQVDRHKGSETQIPKPPWRWE